jgi:hypothetical protein
MSEGAPVPGAAVGAVIKGLQTHSIMIIILYAELVEGQAALAIKGGTRGALCYSTEHRQLTQRQIIEMAARRPLVWWASRFTRRYVRPLSRAETASPKSVIAT